MDIDRTEICRRLSPKTLYTEWRRSYYTHSSWRVQCLKLSVVCIACAFYQHSSLALLSYAIAAGCMILYHVQPKDHCLIFELTVIGSEAINSLNKLIMQGVLLNSRTLSTRQRGINALMKIQALQATKQESSKKGIREILDGGQAFMQMARNLQWIEQLESRLNEFNDPYVAALVKYAFRFTEKEIVECFNALVNNYATLALQAIERPFSPLDQAA